MTAIEWTQKTWNPVTGCDRISPGCDHCYAMALAARLKLMGQPGYRRDGDPRTSGPGFGLTLHDGRLAQPLRWRAPTLIFVNSMSDMFHKEVPVEFIEEVWRVMQATPRHTYQILTKRPKRASRMIEEVGQRLGLAAPLPNVWIGTSIELGGYAWRAEHLRAAPAAVRFISAEPLLGPLLPELDLTDIDWIIVGGESGVGHRPIAADWVRSLRDAAASRRIPFFFKQWGGIRPKSGGRVLDGRTWDELPAGDAGFAGGMSPSTRETVPALRRARRRQLQQP